MLFGCHSLAVPVGRKRMDVGDEGPPVGFRAASATAIWSATCSVSEERKKPSKDTENVK